MGSCDSMMMIEAAFWNPAITGVGMNFTTRASRASPKASWNAPAIDISRKIAAMTSSGSFFGSQRACRKRSAETAAAMNDTRLRGA